MVGKKDQSDPKFSHYSKERSNFSNPTIISRPRISSIVMPSHSEHGIWSLNLGRIKRRTHMGHGV